MNRARRARPPARALALRRLTPEQRGLLRELVQAAEPGSLFLVGGTVRDLLLMRSPAELDVAVTGQPDALALETPGLERRAHEGYRTVSLWRAGRRIADLASTRTEVYPAPGAHPSVRGASLRADLDRRDFTLNAMAAPLRRAPAASFLGVGRLVDPWGGRRDLGRGLLRILHTGSFHDDPTRALRAARLASRWGFRLSRGTTQALRSACAAGVFPRVGAGRWEAELLRLAREPRAVLALRLALAWGVWDALEGEDPSGPALRRAAVLALGQREPEAAPRRLRLMLAALGLDADGQRARRRLSRLVSSGTMASALALADEARRTRPRGGAAHLAALARAAGVP